MSWGFESGRIYNRRQDIHARFGGQMQGGIITPAQHKLVVIITGEAGLQHGYHDVERDDGSFDYYGEGQVGDMELLRGNQAIASHSRFGKSLLLFQKSKRGLKFVDEMVCEGHRLVDAPDQNGATRQAIVFSLRRLRDVAEQVERFEAPSAPDLGALRAEAIAASTADAAAMSSAVRNIYQRSVKVRDYVKARANGACEGCEETAPFVCVDGSPYLEPHHVHRLSDGGPDHPAFVIALCPTCHRRVHFGADGADYNLRLISKAERIEAAHAARFGH